MPRYFLKCSTISISYQQCIKIILHFYHHLVFVFKFKFMPYVIFPRYYNIIYHIHSAVYHVLMAPVFYHWKFVPLIPFTSFAALLPPHGQPSVISLSLFSFCAVCVLDSHNGQNDHLQKIWRGCGEKGILPHCQWECKVVRHREQYGGSSES